VGATSCLSRGWFFLPESLNENQRTKTALTVRVWNPFQQLDLDTPLPRLYNKD
jgi:hypothetical protein